MWVALVLPVALAAKRPASASCSPIVCAWSALLVCLTGQGPTVIPTGIAAFAAVNVPDLIFVAALSPALPHVIGTPLYRVGFIGYWLSSTTTVPAVQEGEAPASV